MKSIYLPLAQFKMLTSSSTRNPNGRGSGRILAWAIALLLLIPGAAFADARGEFPEQRCPGSACPDTAQPKQDECNPKPQCGGDETGIEKCCTAEGQQGPAGG